MHRCHYFITPGRMRVQEHDIFMHHPKELVTHEQQSCGSGKKNTELHPCCFNRNLEGKQKSGSAYQIQLINWSSVSATTSTSADVLAASLSESRWSGMFISSQKWIKFLGTLLKCPLQWRRYPSKFTPRSGCAFLREILTLQASVSMLHVKVHESKVRERQKRFGLFGSTDRKKLFLSKRNIFAKLRLNKPQDPWNSFGQTRP